MTIDILITLNNFIHDLAAALWFCGTLTILVIVREGTKKDRAEISAFVKAVYGRLLLITNASLAVVLLGGTIRALAYRKYEWAEALGRSQVVLLVVKHILLAVIVFAGIYLQMRLSKKIKQLSETK